MSTVESPRAEAEYAVFDFDDTLVSGDSGRAFLRYLIASQPARTLLALVLAPLAVGLLLHRTTFWSDLSCLLWAATVGRSERDLDACYARFAGIYITSAASGRVLNEAWQTLREHRHQERRIVILSGSPTGLVSAIARRIDEGPFTVIGSTARRFASGFIVREHCVRHAKVAMAARAGLADRLWHTGYSDSGLDVPMLLRCRSRYAVNPTPRALRHLTRALGSDVTVVRWR